MLLLNISMCPLKIAFFGKTLEIDEKFTHRTLLIFVMYGGTYVRWNFHLKLALECRFALKLFYIKPACCLLLFPGKVSLVFLSKFSEQMPLVAACLRS